VSLFMIPKWKYRKRNSTRGIPEERQDASFPIKGRGKGNKTNEFTEKQENGMGLGGFFFSQNRKDSNR